MFFCSLSYHITNLLSQVSTFFFFSNLFLGLVLSFLHSRVLYAFFIFLYRFLYYVVGSFLSFFFVMAIEISSFFFFLTLFVNVFYLYISIYQRYISPRTYVLGVFFLLFSITAFFYFARAWGEVHERNGETVRYGTVWYMYSTGCWVLGGASSSA